MNKIYLKSIFLSLLLPSMNAHSNVRFNPPNNHRNSFIEKTKYLNIDSNDIAQEPNCSSVHVWYTLNNKDMKYSWYIQISRLFEDNINFLDESCNRIDINNKIEIPPNRTRKVGMEVTTEKSFNSIYSFTAVRNDEALARVPNYKYACIFVISAYGPGQLNRMDWRLNNADCVSSYLGTQYDLK
ncbi:hypothetical protein [Fluviispira multicolorata]|uniref:Uncharacterized protein n=1 Tax=Fluviispira multicolorata TaxID=2654512 RepID=A0A833JDY4_9BACT|nr:hypothetical protein [Fluviispira multicolorata]KAB8029110.1 hypothetical protein GCL57_11255 [Fluviispira multicolorata]